MDLRERVNRRSVGVGGLGMVFFVATWSSCGGRALPDGDHDGRRSGTGGSGLPGGGGGGPFDRRDAAPEVLGRDAFADAVADGDGSRSPADAIADVAPRDAAPADVIADVAATDAAPTADDAGGRDGGQPEAGPRTRVLSLVLKGAPWYATQFTQGIAVDSSNRVYVGDYANVFMVDGTSLTTYLTAAEAAGPTRSMGRFGDLDIGPDDQLYIALSAFLPGTGDQMGIVRSRMAHQAKPWVDISGVDPRHLAVIADGYVAVVSREGLSTYTAAGGRSIYNGQALIAPSECATEDLAAVPSGIFLYQPGCNGYPLLRGNVDGSGVGILYDTDILSQSSPVLAQNFICAARDPSGGFYIIVDDISDGAPRLYHVAEDAQGTTGLTAVPTVPTFAEAKRSQDETFGFDYCSIAAARDGTVFFQTYSQLWKVSP